MKSVNFVLQTWITPVHLVSWSEYACRWAAQWCISSCSKYTKASTFFCRDNFNSCTCNWAASSWDLSITKISHPRTQFPLFYSLLSSPIALKFDGRRIVIGPKNPWRKQLILLSEDAQRDYKAVFLLLISLSTERKPASFFLLSLLPCFYPEKKDKIQKGV